MVDQYSLPIPEDLLATLANRHKFSKMDLRQAYLQLQLEESSRQHVTTNTHQGLYRYTQLPFGTASTPAIFQILILSILQGVPDTVCYFDDILITGKDEEDHSKNLNKVLTNLEKHSLLLGKSKCTFIAQSVKYLGHMITDEGVRVLPNWGNSQCSPNIKCPKVKVIVRAAKLLWQIYSQSSQHP